MFNHTYVFPTVRQCVHRYNIIILKMNDHITSPGNYSSKKDAHCPQLSLVNAILYFNERTMILGGLFKKFSSASIKLL